MRNTVALPQSYVSPPLHFGEAGAHLWVLSEGVRLLMELACLSSGQPIFDLGRPGAPKPRPVPPEWLRKPRRQVHPEGAATTPAPRRR